MSEETGRMADEDKFLGVRTTIEPPAKTPENVQQDLDIEVLDDRPEDDRRPAADTAGNESEDDDVATDAEIMALYGWINV